jgi:serine/threonine protein kinase/Flp pilus assembly protein TadD
MNTSDRRDFDSVMTAGSDDSATQDDPRVVAALDEYLSLLKQGRRPDRDEFLARHASVAGPLSECLHGLDFVQSAASQMSPMEGASAAVDKLSPTTLLGDFRILRELGRGGMGVVYEAEQLSLGRRVALKVLPFAAALDPRQRQRFQVEAQAAAHLHHPRIVPVYAVGCDHGVHYYAMQYIEGRTLAAVIRELRRAEAPRKPTERRDDELGWKDAASSEPDDLTPTLSVSPGGPAPASSPSLPDTATATGSSQRGRAFFRTVAVLGRQAAEALDHAHSLGVLHRDIKPANLMVDGHGGLWVTDFGLARFQGDLGLTGTGDTPGTLRYMSPEQTQARRGVVDQRTDIYSLGATLYELATLRPVFDGRDRQELLHQITFDEPVPPRRHDPSIPRDLETILLKALSKDPASRYATAQEMADDLGRFLDDKPVQARRPTPLEHAAKWTRRHRVAVTTAVVVALLAAAVGTTLLWVEHQKTLAALGREREARKVAEANRKVAEAKTKLAQRHVRLHWNYADSINIEAMGALAQYRTMEGAKRNGYYMRALDFYEKIAAENQDDPEMRSTTALANHRVGFVRMILGYIAGDVQTKEDHYRRSDEAYRRSIGLYEELLKPDPTDQVLRQGLGLVLNDYSALLMGWRGFDAAMPFKRRRLEIQRQLVADYPLVGDYLTSLTNDQVEWSQMLDQIGKQVGDKGKVEEAARLRADLFALYAKLAAKDPKDADLRKQLDSGYQFLATRLMATGFRHDAEKAFRQALEFEPGDPTLLNGLAWLLACRPDLPPHDPSQAVKLAKQALERAPKSRDILNTLGVAYFRAGDLKSAAEALRESERLHQGGGDASDWFYLALVDRQQGDRQRATDEYKKAVEWMKNRGQQAPDQDLEFIQQEATKVLGPTAPKSQEKPEHGAAKP